MISRLFRLYLLVALAVGVTVPGASAAEWMDPCTDLGKMEQHTRSLGALSGAFEMPVLPGGGEARFIIKSNLASLEGQRLCGMIVWAGRFDACTGGDRPGECERMTLLHCPHELSALLRRRNKHLRMRMRRIAKAVNAR